MIICGAGLAGLLAATMLQHHKPIVFEKQPRLPNNHSAVLRFRSTTFSDVVGIPFKPVKLIKHVIPWRNPVADALAYSDKNTGKARSDRSITNEKDDGVRYIAPADLIAQLATRANIRFHTEIFFNTGVIGGTDPSMRIRKDEPCISTMPMPLLMDALEWPDKPAGLEFHHAKGMHMHARINDCDAYVGIQFPERGLPFSRASVTGDSLIIEGSVDLDIASNAQNALSRVAEALGIARDRIHSVTMHRQTYAKIHPIDDEVRKNFIFWASHDRNVWSLGRFATWRPALLLDDLVQDVRRINSWIAKKDAYQIRRDS